MYQILMVIFLVVAIAIIAFVLLQQGKGAGMGASFGAGASATLFGSSGSGNFMTRTTGILIAIFFILSLVLGNLSNRQANAPITGGDSKFSDLSLPASTVPSAPSTGAAAQTAPAAQQAPVSTDIPGNDSSTNKPVVPQ